MFCSVKTICLCFIVVHAVSVLFIPISSELSSNTIPAELLSSFWAKKTGVPLGYAGFWKVYLS